MIASLRQSRGRILLRGRDSPEWRPRQRLGSFAIDDRRTDTIRLRLKSQGPRRSWRDWWRAVTANRRCIRGSADEDQTGLVRNSESRWRLSRPASCVSDWLDGRFGSGGTEQGGACAETQFATPSTIAPGQQVTVKLAMRCTAAAGQSEIVTIGMPIGLPKGVYWYPSLPPGSTYLPKTDPGEHRRPGYHDYDVARFATWCLQCAD